VFFAIDSAITGDLDNVMLPLAPSDITLLFMSVPGGLEAVPRMSALVFGYLVGKLFKRRLARPRRASSW
jgi:hypothetical protein